MVEISQTFVAFSEYMNFIILNLCVGVYVARLLRISEYVSCTHFLELLTRKNHAYICVIIQFPIKTFYLFFNELYFRYVWNEYLTDPVKDMIHHDWILNIIHGFVDQANISVYGSPILLTLVARRSCRFAGTRFLKRGANYKGK